MRNKYVLDYLAEIAESLKEINEKLNDAPDKQTAKAAKKGKTKVEYRDAGSKAEGVPEL